MDKRVKGLYDKSILFEKYGARVRYKNVEDVKELSDCKTLSDLVKRLTELYAFIVYTPNGMEDSDTYKLEDKTEYYSVYSTRELAMAQDIRFNYKDMEIYVPFVRYRYNTLDSTAIDEFNIRGYSENDLIQNSATSDRIIIHRGGKYVNDTIDVILGDINNNLKVIRLNISELPIYDKCDTTAESLFNRYLKCCYSGRAKDPLEDFFYTSSNYSRLEFKHKRALKALSIPWYTDETEHFYKCFRKYKLDEIQESYTDEGLGLHEKYQKCLIDFESYLYNVFQSDLDIIGWNVGTLKGLKDGKYRYLKYKRGSVALIMLSEIFTKGVVKNVRR